MRYIFVLFLIFISIEASEIAVAKSVKGTVTAKNSTDSIKVIDGSNLDSGMVIMTKDKSSVTIIFKDNSELILGSNSLLNLKKYVFEPVKDEYDFELFLEEGSLSFESGKISDMSPEDFVLSTPEGTVAIRGTKFFVKVQ